MSPSFANARLRSLIVVGLLALLVAGAAVFARPAPALADTAGFPDVPSNHPYHVQIETLAQLGVISGFGDGTFRPGAPVTRQQFVKMAIEAMRIAVSEADVCVFTDVEKSGSGSLYPDNYVAAADRENIVGGYAGSNGPVFKPGASVTLAQMITMATRSTYGSLVVPPSSYKSAWSNFDTTHGVIARVAQYNGLLRELAPAGTTLSSMSPWMKATRGQAAAVLFNIMGTDPDALNGRFLGDSSDLVKMFRARGLGDGKFQNITLEALAKLYVSYGKRFGIRADMAWAQMIHETGYGQYGGDVAPEQNNMAGIGATGGIPGHSFQTAELGVIAQLVHLAWYTYPEHMSDEYCVMVQQPVSGPITAPGDPRHFTNQGKVHPGTVRTVQDLSGKWAPGSEYGAKIRQYADSIVASVGYW
jgi:hypothetical protein